MNLNATLRGDDLTGLDAKADEVCRTFYGTRTFTIVDQPWNGAYAEFDDAGNLNGFRLDIQATSVE